MISVEVIFYAQLKDYFGDQTALELTAKATAMEIRSALVQRNALASDWLKVSRFASEDAFLGEDHQLMNGGKYYLLPPSSGG